MIVRPLLVRDRLKLICLRGGAEFFGEGGGGVHPSANSILKYVKDALDSENFSTNVLILTFSGVLTFL